MPTSQARVPTSRARRYLSQLGKHTARLGPHMRHRPGTHDAHAAPPVARPGDWSETEGVIDFGWARCTVQATDDELLLTAEADDDEHLARIQDGIAGRLERIGRRDELRVTWTRTPPDDHAQAEAESAASIVDALMTPAGRIDPFPLYAKALRLGPASSIADGWFLVSGYDAVNQALRDPGFGLPQTGSGRSESEPGTSDALRSIGRSILRANPPDHYRMRSLISQEFTPRRVATLQPAIEAAVELLLDGLADAGAGGRQVDFMDAFAFQLPVTVICELLGVPHTNRARFRPLAADLTEALELSTDLSGPADAAARELADYFTALIAERRAAPTDDLIGALVAARDADDGRLSETELLGNLITLLVAGFETTTNLLGNGLAILLGDRGLAENLRSGSTPVTAFIEEVLRYDSPVQLTTRIALQDGLAIGNLPVPRDSQLLLLIGAANRDPARYLDPDRFNSSRTDTKPLSFGAGAHICIGNGLARLEASIALPRLLERFPNLSPAPGAPPTRRDRLVLRGYETLPVITGYGNHEHPRT